MYRFFESIQLLDGEFLHLNYHQKRVDRTFAKYFANEMPLPLDLIVRESRIPTKGKFKYRIGYDSRIQSIDIEPYTPLEIRSVKLVGSNIDYTYKSENREDINFLMQAREGKDDILIIKNGLLTDSSFCNVALNKKGIWYTPRNPLMAGTQRAFLLEKKRIVEIDISIDDIDDYEELTLFNAMNSIGEIVIPISQVF